MASWWNTSNAAPTAIGCDLPQLGSTWNCAGTVRVWAMRFRRRNGMKYAALRTKEPIDLALKRVKVLLTPPTLPERDGKRGRKKAGLVACFFGLVVPDSGTDSAATKSPALSRNPCVFAPQNGQFTGRFSGPGDDPFFRPRAEYFCVKRGIFWHGGPPILCRRQGGCSRARLTGERGWPRLVRTYSGAIIWQMSVPLLGSSRYMLTWMRHQYR